MMTFTQRLLDISEHKLSRFLTPFFDRFVYGLVYPAVVGASLVEIVGKVRDPVLALPWFAVVVLFTIDYSLTGAETSTDSPRGNVLMSLADLAAAAAFLYSYLALAAWDGGSQPSAADLKRLMTSVWLYHAANLLWYLARYSTRTTAAIRSGVAAKYYAFLQTNFTLMGIQTALVTAAAACAFTIPAKAMLCLWISLTAAFGGMLLRNVRDYMYGPWVEQ